MNVFGQVETLLPFDAFARIFDHAGWHTNVGRYSVRVSGPLGDYKFVYNGGEYFLEDGIDAADVLAAARSLSALLSSHGLRHRFEIYEENDRLVLYLHHNWPCTLD